MTKRFVFSSKKRRLEVKVLISKWRTNAYCRLHVQVQSSTSSYIHQQQQD